MITKNNMDMKQRIWKIGLLMFLFGLSVNQIFAQECKEFQFEDKGTYYFDVGYLIGIKAENLQAAIKSFEAFRQADGVKVINESDSTDEIGKKL